jgi:hypothetical protein
MRQAFVKPGWRPLLLRSTSSSNSSFKTLSPNRLARPADGLLDGADAAHHFGALLQQLPQLLMRLPHHLVHGTTTLAGATVSGVAACLSLPHIDLHNPSTTHGGRPWRPTMTAECAPPVIDTREFRWQFPYSACLFPLLPSSAEISILRG